MSMRGLNTLFIIHIKVIGALKKPNNITINLKRTSLILKVVSIYHQLSF
jgi:hypothetical protein